MRPYIPLAPDISNLHRLARALRARSGITAPRAGRPLPALVLVTDEFRLPDPLPMAREMPSGSGVLLRHYGAPGRSALAEKLAEICRSRGLTLWIGADLALANTIGADGLHLPERLVWRPRPPVPGHMILTASAHSPKALRRSHAIGADAALLSPVFPTASHLGRAPLGRARFRRWVGRSGLAVYALGGVTVRNTGQLMGSGAAGIAATGGLAGTSR